LDPFVINPDHEKEKEIISRFLPFTKILTQSQKNEKLDSIFSSNYHETDA